MRHLAIILPLAFTVLAVGCTEPKPMPEQVDMSFVGSWKMDMEATKKAQIEVLEKAGTLNNANETSQFEQLFDQSYFDFRLQANLDFKCSMGNLLEKGGFTGYWKTSGEEISMIQTHENNKPKKDRMDGHRKDGKLFMTHRNQGIDLPYIFVKANRENGG